MNSAATASRDAARPNNGQGRLRIKRWQAVVLCIVASIVLLLLVFDWNWLRAPLERYVSDKTEREFRVADLDVDLGMTPTIKLKGVYFANTPWSKSQDPMARIGSLEFSISLRDLWDKKILVPRAAMSQADLVFEKSSDLRKNWVLKAPARSAEPGKVRIGSISVDQGRLRYLNHAEPFDVDVAVSTFEPVAAEKAKDADAGPQNNRYTTRYAFKGKYHEAGFTGEALTGSVLSFMETDVAFPIKGSLNAGTTRVSVEGTMADVVRLQAVDVQLRIAGQTLASLYPFLLLPLPASPPYDFRGHLVRKGNRYAIEDLSGRIGITDVAGSGAYVDQQPRPLLTAKLRSKLLNLADLGPVIGLETKDTRGGVLAGTTKPTQAQTNTRAQAQAKERSTAGDRVLPARAAAKGDGVLPTGKFEGGRLKAIDAQVDYAAAALKAPGALPVENMKFTFQLKDAVARLAPLEFGFAGGRIISEVAIDARDEKLLQSTFNADFRNIKIARLFPDKSDIAKGVGEIGAQVRLKGVGNSIAEAAGASNGTVTAAVANGRISNLMDAAAGLNGGKVLALFVGGDKEIPVNCGALYFDVSNGLGQSRLFVVDTAQTRVDGQGTFNLKDERFAFTVEPKPKKPGLLSLRTPVRLHGSFRHPDFSLDKGPLMMRAGGALALGLLNPLAAILPLIETGPGTDTDCARVLAPVQGAQQQAQAVGTALPKAVPAGSAKGRVKTAPKPVVNAPAIAPP
jgi:AsmA family protein